MGPEELKAAAIVTSVGADELRLDSGNLPDLGRVARSVGGLMPIRFRLNSEVQQKPMKEWA